MPEEKRSFINLDAAKGTSSIKKGRAAETAALAYLRQQGLRLIEQNFFTRWGEIDLIMCHQQTLVFVEVRQRTNTKFGGAVASVSQAKQDRLWKTAQIYLQRYAVPPPCRFDLLAFHGSQVAWIHDIMAR